MWTGGGESCLLCIRGAGATDPDRPRQGQSWCRSNPEASIRLSEHRGAKEQAWKTHQRRRKNLPFVQRLRHDCNGAGVKWHHTAAALFTVQNKRIDYGFEPDYAEGLVVCLEDQTWFSPKEYWDDLDDDERGEMDDQVMADRECGFLDLDEDDQWDILRELDDHTVTGWNHRWEIVNSHFTKDAAEAFIRRKKHDYVGETEHCWYIVDEFHRFSRIAW